MNKGYKLFFESIALCGLSYMFIDNLRQCNNTFSIKALCNDVVLAAIFSLVIFNIYKILRLKKNKSLS